MKVAVKKADTQELELLLEKTINLMYEYATKHERDKIQCTFMRLNGQIDVIQTLELLPAARIEQYDTRIQDTFVSLMRIK